MARREPMTSLEVCNNAYEWKERDLEGAKRMQDSEDEEEGYVDLDNDQICSPSIYQRIFSRRQSRKAVGEKKAVTSQPSRDRRVKEKNQRENHHENKHKTSRSTKMPSSHMVLAVSSLFICIFCWPAAPCAILATIYGIQVGHHWKAGHHHEARSASTKAKELATTALVCGGINAVICFVLTLTSILIALGTTGYLSKRVPVHTQ